MITITPAAATQIRRSQKESQAEGLALRIAVTIEDNGSFAYGMGFDERKERDVEVVSEGIALVLSEGSRDALLGATLDYVELNPDEFRFIFVNPNDPSHKRANSKS